MRVLHRAAKGEGVSQHNARGIITRNTLIFPDGTNSISTWSSTAVNICLYIVKLVCTCRAFMQWFHRSQRLTRSAMHTERGSVEWCKFISVLCRTGLCTLCHLLRRHWFCANCRSFISSRVLLISDCDVTFLHVKFFLFRILCSYCCISVMAIFYNGRLLNNYANILSVPLWGVFLHGYQWWSLETRVSSRDTYVHVSVLAQSRRIHVLSWLESRSSMSRLGSVSWLSYVMIGSMPTSLMTHGLSTTVLESLLSVDAGHM